MSRAALPLLSFTLLAGCGAAPPPEPDPLAHYPEARFIVAEGRGPTALAAGDDAKVRLSAGIRARITARMTVETRQSADGTAERVEQRIITETTFDRAELIRLPRALQRCEARGGPDGCVAVAVLDRAEAGGALRDGAAEAASRFRAAATQAMGAAPDDWLGFTTGLRSAEVNFEERARAGWQRSVIEGGIPADFAADRDAFHRLQTERARRLSGLRITMRPALGFDGPWAARVEDGLIDGLGRLGPTAHRGECVGLAAQPSGSLTCARGGLGPTCRMTLSVALTRCDGAPLVTLTPPPIGAVDPRTEERARARLAQQVSGAELSPLLGRSLVGVLPIARPAVPAEGAP